MSDKKRQTEEQQELRDLDAPAGAAQEVKPFLSGNHNLTLVRAAISANHNEALVRGYVADNHNETLARKEQDELRDLEVPEKDAEGVKGGTSNTKFKFASQPTPGHGRPSSAHLSLSLGDGTTIER
jgi:hypothetical protein